jgi:hypothetical protein
MAADQVKEVVINQEVTVAAAEAMAANQTREEVAINQEVTVAAAEAMAANQTREEVAINQEVTVGAEVRCTVHQKDPHTGDVGKSF